MCRPQKFVDSANSLIYLLNLKNQSSSKLVKDIYVKVKQSYYRPGQNKRVLKNLRFADFVTMAQGGGRLSALGTGRLYPPGKYSWYSFLLEA